jgi:surface antigen
MSNMSGMALAPLVRVAVLLLAGTLSACASSRYATGPNLAATSRHPGINCAPFARELSGVALYGSAADWWTAAAGRYDRSDRPEIGAVLVFRRTERLRSGHVAVVSRVVGAREVLVIQANWVPDALTEDHLVVDVSSGNDWSEVRVWWPPTSTMGAATYPTHGFILPPAPATHAELRRAAEPAARLALTSAAGRPPPRARSYGG